MTSQIAHAKIWIERGWGQLLEVVFPARCASCRKPGAAMCDECVARFAFITPPFCSVCSSQLQDANDKCPNERNHQTHVESIRAMGWFEGTLREAIHALKYDGRKDVAPLLAELLYKQSLSIPQVDYITAVPLHSDRQRQRGYNQSYLLASELAARVKRPYVEGLERTRATADQIGLGPADRKKNVNGAFEAFGSRVHGADILLIDDVCTTSATMDACAKALRDGGAKRVRGLVVARARYQGKP